MCSSAEPIRPFCLKLYHKVMGKRKISLAYREKETPGWKTFVHKTGIVILAMPYSGMTKDAFPSKKDTAKGTGTI